MTFVVHSQTIAQSTTATPQITLPATPSAGQEVLLAIATARSTPRTISSVAGGGATWVLDHTCLDGSRGVVYRGTGFTGAGPITVTLSSTQTNTTLAAWVVSGRPAGAAYVSTMRFQSAAALTTPPIVPVVGEPVFVVASGLGTLSSFPTGTTEPSSGWTTTTTGISGAGYLVAASEARHSLTLTQTTAVGLLVLAFTLTVPSRYWQKFVVDYAPTEYYRLNEATGATSLASMRGISTNSDMAVAGSPTFGVADPMPGPDPAITLGGSDAGATTATGGSTYTTERTLVAWVKISTAPGSNRVAAYSMGYHANSSTLWGLGATSTGVATAAPGQAATFLDGTTNICDGNWHMLAVTVEADNLGRLYVDGVLEATSGATVTPSTQMSRQYLGQYNGSTWGSSGVKFTGSVDEIGSTATALTAAQIAELYTWGTVGPVETHYGTGTVDLVLALEGSAVKSQGVTGTVDLALALEGNAVKSQPVTGDLDLALALEGSAIKSQAVTGTIDLDLTLEGNASSVDIFIVTGTIDLGLALEGNAVSAKPVTGTVDLDLTLEGHAEIVYPPEGYEAYVGSTPVTVYMGDESAYFG